MTSSLDGRNGGSCFRESDVINAFFKFSTLLDLELRLLLELTVLLSKSEVSVRRELLFMSLRHYNDDDDEDRSSDIVAQTCTAIRS
jgi:hypothetical protein